jgi:tetratricopeptide (TPR) repeat protein
LLVLLMSARFVSGQPMNADRLFQDGLEAYRAGEYKPAVEAFRQAVALRPASGTLQNLGNAEWQCGHPGRAILAWEQALWLDPFAKDARNNLRFARKSVEVEAPDLAWYEVVSSWLPANWWGLIAGSSFWLAFGIGALPGLLRWRKAAWHQALAAFFLALFLLSVPAHRGVDRRSQIGFVLEKNAPLRLTPTEDAQLITRLGTGEPARVMRARGKYLLVRNRRTSGWVERAQFGLLTGEQK